MSTYTKCRPHVGLLAAAGVLAAAVAAVPAGAGIGDNFKLGKTNTANATSLLTGTTAGPELLVKNADGGGVHGETAGGNAAAVKGFHNSGEGAGAGVVGLSRSSAPSAFAVYGLLLPTTPGLGSAAVRGENNGTGFNGFGVFGSHAGAGVGVRGDSTTGTGVYGRGGSLGGSFSSPTGVGLEASAPADDGIRSSSNAANKSGVWAHHEGRNFGYGLFAESAVGPAIGLQGPDSGQPPITLNGNPFPSATAGYKDAGVVLPTDDAMHPIASLSLGAGTYVVIAKAVVWDIPATGEAWVECRLSAGVDFDDISVRPGSDVVSLTLFHSFAAAGVVRLSCAAASGFDAARVQDTKIVAIRVAGGTNTAMP